MKKITLFTILACLPVLATPGWADEAQNKETAKPAARKAPSTQVAGKPKRFQDARHCLERATNLEIIKCAEEYL